MTVHVVYAGSGYDQPIIYGVFKTAALADRARKDANTEFNRTKATIGAFRVKRLGLIERWVAGKEPQGT